MLSKEMFNGCESLYYIELPKSVEKIESAAFGNCDSLRKINIYSNVEYIHDQAFWKSKGVTICS